MKYTGYRRPRDAAVAAEAGRPDNAYDSTSRLTTVTNQTTGRSLTFSWSSGHVSSVSTQSVAAHAGPLTWSYGYTGDKLTTATGPHTANPTTYSYAFNGKLGQITLPRGNIETTVGYRVDGSVEWRDNGLGKRTGYEVISTSPTTVVRVTDPSGHAVDWEYKNGQLISRRDGTGDRRFAYNDRGFLSQVTDENGNLLVLKTDSRGNVLERTTVRMNLYGTLWRNTEYYEYFVGAAGDPRNDLVIAVRDGRSASAVDNTYRTTYSYNVFGDLVQTRTPGTPDFPSGRATNWAFTTGAEAAIGGGTVPRGLLLSATDSRGESTTFGYDSVGDLRRDQDPAGLVHEFTYDVLGRRLTSTEISKTFPAGVTATYAYTKLSRLAQLTEPGILNPIAGGSATHTRRLLPTATTRTAT